MHVGELAAREPVAHNGQLARDVAATTSSFYAAGALVAASDLLLTTATQVELSLERILPVRRLALPFPSPGVTISQFWHTRLGNDPTNAWLRPPRPRPEPRAAAGDLAAEGRGRVDHGVCDASRRLIYGLRARSIRSAPSTSFLGGEHLAAAS
jgi:hypothetical protein